ncbi:YggT family protein [bacterium]|nr:YggT family protein [bacterium]
MNNQTYTVLIILSTILSILTYAIIIRALLSWIRSNPNNPLVRLLNQVTDPIMKPFERLVPSLGGLDITPIIAIVLIQGVQWLLPRLLGA